MTKAGTVRAKSVNMQDVARLAGVSQATASYVMADRPGISDATRKRVLRSARELGYRPNRLASGLLRGKSRSIGVVLPGQSTDFGWGIFRGLQAEMVREGYVPILLDSRIPECDGLDELEVMRRFMDYRTEGIILYGVSEASSHVYLHELRERNVPVVTIDHELSGAEVDHVGTENVALGRRVAEQLLARGYCVLGHLADRELYSPARDRRRGFVEAAAEQGANVRVVEVEGLGYGEREAARLVADMPPGGVVFAGTDILARTLYHAAFEAGRRIPGDLAVMGTGNAEWSRWQQPPLSTVEQHPEEIGRRAVRLMLSRLRGEAPPDARREFVPFELLWRRSTREAP